MGEIDFGACVASSVDVSTLKSVLQFTVDACSSGSPSVFALPVFPMDQSVSQVRDEVATVSTALSVQSLLHSR